MKRVWISVALIIVTIWGCLASQHYLNTLTAQLAGQVKQADILMQNGNVHGCTGLVQDSYGLWKQKEPVVGAIIRHQEMDDIEGLYIRTLQNAVNGDAAEYLVQAKELEGLLLHLADMEKPKMKNLF